MYYACCRAVSLHLGRIQCDPKMRIPPFCDPYDVPHRRPGGRRNDAKMGNKRRQRLLVFFGKHPHFSEFFFQLLEPPVQVARARFLYVLCYQLVCAVSRIDGDIAGRHDIVPFLHPVSQSAAVVPEHGTRQLARRILEIEIDMS